jgi:hypothetical protein
MGIGDPKQSLEIYREMRQLAAEINQLRTQGIQNDGEELIRIKKLVDLKKAEQEILEQEIDLREQNRKILSLENKYFIDIGKTFKANVETAKAYRDLQKANQSLLKSVETIEAQIGEARRENNTAELKFLEERKKGLEDQLKTQQLQAQSAGRSVIGGKLMAEVMGRMAPVVGVIGKSFGIIGDIIGGLVGLLKAPFDYFERIDKAARSISVDVGMTQNQMILLRREASGAAANIQAMGVSVADILTGQKVYNDELGKTVILTKNQQIAMAQIALGTDLGADGAARMAAGFEAFGYNMENVRDMVEETFITNQKLGLNSSKVLKNIEGSLKTAQKYSFKDGAKNLAQMAQTATSVKMSMESVFGLSEKLFELEGAVELSAQLQVLGGSFAALGDPMQLIYQARNDMEGLQKSLIEATKGVAMFDKATGEFRIPSAELHRLRKVAEATGISIDEMTQSALELSKQDMALSQLNKGLTFSDEQLAAIKNLAQLNKGTGKFEINLGGMKPELLENLNPDRLNDLMTKQNTLAQAAAQRLTFFEKIKNIFETFKAGLAPVIEKFMTALDNSGFADKLTNAMVTISNTIANTIEGGGLEKFLDSLITALKSAGDFIADMFSPNKNTTLNDVLNNLGRTLAAVLTIAWNNSIGRLGSLLRIENSAGNDIMSFDDVDKVNDGDISPSGLVVSKPTPRGLKPIAQGAPDDTAYLRKNGMGGDVNVNLNGTLKLDLGMGVSLDMRRDLIDNPEFKYSILQLVSNKMLELTNGTA